jgi:hypothetical protein
MSRTERREARPILSGDGNAPAAINRSSVRRDIASRCAACFNVISIGVSEMVAEFIAVFLFQNLFSADNHTPIFPAGKFVILP